MTVQVGMGGGGNMKLFEDWYTELNLLSRAAQMTTNLSAHTRDPQIGLWSLESSVNEVSLTAMLLIMGLLLRKTENMNK